MISVALPRNQQRETPFLDIATELTTVFRFQYTMLEEDPHLLWTYTCTVSMHVVRCTGFAVELCWSQKHIAKQEKSSSLLKNRQAMQSNQYHFFSSFYKLLEYQFYFPLFISGPIVNYNEFKNQVCWCIALGIPRYSLVLF